MSFTTNPPFKKGDKVVCIDDDNGNKKFIKKNEKYVVLRCYKDDDEWYVQLSEIPDKFIDGYYAHRFKLAMPWNYRG